MTCKYVWNYVGVYVHTADGNITHLFPQLPPCLIFQTDIGWGSLLGGRIEKTLSFGVVHRFMTWGSKTSMSQ